MEAEKGPPATAIEDEKANVQSFREAQAASKAEHDTDLRTALRENWKAALWSLVISLTIVMEGYDMALMSNFFGVSYKVPFKLCVVDTRRFLASAGISLILILWYPFCPIPLRNHTCVSFQDPWEEMSMGLV